jgi:hypothetical protein
MESTHLKNSPTNAYCQQQYQCKSKIKCECLIKYIFTFRLSDFSISRFPPHWKPCTATTVKSWVAHILHVQISRQKHCHNKEKIKVYVFPVLYWLNQLLIYLRIWKWESLWEWVKAPKRHKTVSQTWWENKMTGPLPQFNPSALRNQLA